MSFGGYQGIRIISVKVNRNAMAMQFAQILADEKVLVHFLLAHCRPLPPLSHTSAFPTAEKQLLQN
jgi:hypothetical protein